MDTRGKGRKRGVAAEQVDKTKAKRARTSTGTSTPSGASTPSGTKGSQRGKKKKRTTLQQTHDYVYYEGWKMQKDMPPELVHLSQVPKTMLYETRTRDHVEELYNKIVQRFAGLKKSPDDVLTEGKLLAMVLQPAMGFLHQCINRRFNGANKHNKKVKDTEFGQFIAMLLWVSASNHSLDDSISDLRAIASEKLSLNGNNFLDSVRFKEILQFFSGAEVGLHRTTRTSHEDTSRGPEQFREFSSLLNKPLALITTDNFITITIDDRIIKFRGIGNLKIAVNDKKRNNFGIGSDAACDATFRIKLDSELGPS